MVILVQVQDGPAPCCLRGLQEEPDALSSNVSFLILLEKRSILRTKMVASLHRDPNIDTQKNTRVTLLL